MTTAKSLGKTLLTTLTTTTLCISETGSWVHLWLEISTFFIFGKFLMSLWSYHGNISYLISESAGGTISSVIFCSLTFQQSHLASGFKSKSEWNHTTGMVKVMRINHSSHGILGIAIRDLVLLHTSKSFWQFISSMDSSLTTISWSHPFTHFQSSDFCSGLVLDLLVLEKGMKMPSHGVPHRESMFQLREDIDGFAPLSWQQKLFSAGNTEKTLVTSTKKQPWIHQSTYGFHGQQHLFLWQFGGFTLDLSQMLQWNTAINSTKIPKTVVQLIVHQKKRDSTRDSARRTKRLSDENNFELIC